MKSCYYFMTNGTCRLGDKCKFQHTKSNNESNSNLQHSVVNKYATICRQFINEGSCKFGEKCKFLHVIAIPNKNGKIPICRQSSSRQTKQITTRKKSIPSTVKRLVWNKYIGEHIGKEKCYCCKLSDITQLSFHCGHVVSEKYGGKIEVENLRPICQNCNSSMGTVNMNVFIKKYNIHKSNPY